MNAPLHTPSAPERDGAHPAPSQEFEAPAIDITTIFRFLRRRWTLIAGVAVALTLVAALVVLQLTPRYTATALLLLNPPKQNVVDFEAVLAGTGNDAASIASEIEIIQSRALAEQVINSLGLMNDPEIAPVDETALGSGFNPRNWIASLFGSKPVMSKEELDARRLNGAIDQLIKMETVDQKSLTRILEVSITSEDPKKAARIANALADAYVTGQIEAKFEATRQANEWLAKRLDELGKQLQESDRAVEIYRTANGLQASSGVTINDQQLSELNAQLILARADSAEKQAKYDRARQILTGHGNIESVTDVVQSGTIGALRGQEAELARRQADLSTKYGPRHPAILNIDAQRRDIQRQIGAEVQRIVGSISNELAVSKSRVKALEDSLNQLQDKAGQNNQAAVRLRELERQSAANRTVYESFLNRFKETGQQQDLQTADSRVIGHAIEPQTASYPKTAKLLLGAAFVSLAIGAGLAFLLELLDNGITTASRIEGVLGLPLLTSIPLIPMEKGANGKPMTPQDYILQKPLSAYSEALRSLRSSLALSNVDNPPKVILFTSALPDEGKTTTSVSFARAAAHSGLKVLLLDGDLRHPSVHKALTGAKSVEHGLVEILAGHCSLADATEQDSATSLYYLSVAKGTVNPPDLLGSAQMRRLVAQCRNAYDLVIIDSPPVLPVVDARVLAQLVDKTIFVVRWDKTPREAARNAMKELRQFNADVAGAVLTLVDTTKQSKYGYGDSSYYYGRYSRYYSN
jgi:exopolysaccharide transport family protein